MLGTTEIIFIALIVLLLFGGKKIPELMKGVGKGMRSFKQGMNGVDEESADNRQKNEATFNEQNGTTEEKQSSVQSE